MKNRAMFRKQALHGVASAGILLLATITLSGCDRRTCLQWHAEERMTMQPVLVGFSNNAPQYSYVPEYQAVDVCDVYAEAK